MAPTASPGFLGIVIEFISKLHDFETPKTAGRLLNTINKMK